MQKKARLIACESKHGFESYHLAAAVAGRSRRRKSDKINPYRCRFCKMWHVGGTPLHNQGRK